MNLKAYILIHNDVSIFFLLAMTDLWDVVWTYPQSPCVGSLIPNVVMLGGGASGRYLGHGAGLQKQINVIIQGVG